MLLMKEISLYKAPRFPQRCNTSASTLDIECLIFAFERIQDSIKEDFVSTLPKPVCHINGSKIASLMLIERTSITFSSFLKELLDMLGYFPSGALGTSRIFIDDADLKLRDNIRSYSNRLGIRIFEARVNEIKMLEEEIRTRGKYMTKTTNLINFLRY
ncbi:hypothetical protein NE237_013644 [Protea cynaroides]|uniref:Uncharacterized protein n=1 Tax=Protea cynaroides TaxID=273540 RepID=A0A9Q0H1D4_9MAGN|nr:hypothetical protein NE237_013644 [Protea cynaroides]